MRRNVVYLYQKNSLSSEAIFLVQILEQLCSLCGVFFQLDMQMVSEIQCSVNFKLPNASNDADICKL